MSYSDLTRRYFEAAPQAGVLLTASGALGQGVHRGSAGQRERGTWVQFDVRVAAQRVVEARFLAFGCPHTIAVAAWVAQQAAGVELRAALPQAVTLLAQHFEVPAEKLGRMLIIEDAWLVAARSALTASRADPMYTPD